LVYCQRNVGVLIRDQGCRSPSVSVRTNPRFSTGQIESITWRMENIFPNFYQHKKDTKIILMVIIGKINRLAKALLSLLNGVDILLVPDLSSVDFLNKDEDLTVAAYRKKANGNELYAIELD